MKTIKTISEILIEADKTDELKVLCNCWEEIVKNRYFYPLTHIDFAREHLVNLAKQMARKDMRELKIIPAAWSPTL